MNMPKGQRLPPLLAHHKRLLAHLRFTRETLPKPAEDTKHPWVSCQRDKNFTTPANDTTNTRVSSEDGKHSHKTTHGSVEQRDSNQFDKKFHEPAAITKCPKTSPYSPKPIPTLLRGQPEYPTNIASFDGTLN
ncbi:hypothetical protein ACROYT_G003880 [Oculina patagonica]